MSAGAIIGIDWGSTNLRAFRFDAVGQVVERRATARGAATLNGAAAFEEALAAIVDGWTDGDATIVLAGMAGSRGGWREAPYLPCPADPGALAAAALRIPGTLGELCIVPGLCCRNDAGIGDVMRGEETQILGLTIDDAMVVLPGTHAKWAQLRGGRVETFRTAMTGELFALLRQRSVLGRLADPDAAHDQAAFLRGVDRALDAGDALRLLFTARSEVLLGTLEPGAVTSYLAGLLIGGDVATCGVDPVAPVVLVGSNDLCVRYEAALRRAGYQHVSHVDGDDAVARGLWMIGGLLE